MLTVAEEEVSLITIGKRCGVIDSQIKVTLISRYVCFTFHFFHFTFLRFRKWDYFLFFKNKNVKNVFDLIIFHDEFDKIYCAFNLK